MVKGDLCFLFLSSSFFAIFHSCKIGTKVKGVDLDAPGSINGVPLLEVDLDSFEDKPWRKPGKIMWFSFNIQKGF